MPLPLDRFVSKPENSAHSNVSQFGSLCLCRIDLGFFNRDIYEVLMDFFLVYLRSSQSRALNAKVSTADANDATHAWKSIWKMLCETMNFASHTHLHPMHHAAAS